jgi:glycosyltransferase involved in cell wall biosynthesis
MPFVASLPAQREPPPRVCVVGQHELDYPRNVVNQRLMRAAGYEIVLCHSRARVPFRTWSIVVQYLRVAKTTRVVFATEGSHRHVPWLKLATLWSKQAIIFDPFISLYNTEVEDRKLYRPGSLAARVARWRDLVACRCADFLVFDTADHKDYFFERYRLDKPYHILRVGVDEAVFRPLTVQPTAAGAVCQVLFYGTYIPLQGIDVIVAAAERLRADRSIEFTLVGDGQERARIHALADRLALPNLTFVDRLPPEQLALRIAAADICLGVFDAGIKAGQVVPKVVQCAAMQKAIITRESPAVGREFQAGVSALLVPPADPAALAAAVASLARDAQRRAALGREARKVFDARFSQLAQTAGMRALLDAAARDR